MCKTGINISALNKQQLEFIHIQQGKFFWIILRTDENYKNSCIWNISQLSQLL